MDDKGIIDLYLDRSEKAISETAVKYGKYCFSIAFNILTDKEDSEESVNDTWLAAWNNIPPRVPAILSTFLGKITRNISLNRWKSRRAYKRGGGGGGMSEGDETRKFSHYARFDIPIPREDIEAITICDTVYNLDKTE